MAYLRISEARAAGQGARSYISKSASQMLTEDARRFSSLTHYDVFLSHAYKDGDAILGVKKLIEAEGLTVYVDWIEDATLDRASVTRTSARLLRERMRVCSSLVYAHTANSSESAWMPWELGYFDGFRPGFVWIMPIVESSDSEYRGQEYLGLYPPIQNVSSLSGRISFAFTNFGETRSNYPLNKAAKGTGISFAE
jgi:hypothetical protein